MSEPTHCRFNGISRDTSGNSAKEEISSRNTCEIREVSNGRYICDSHNMRFPQSLDNPLNDFCYNLKWMRGKANTAGYMIEFLSWLDMKSIHPIVNFIIDCKQKLVSMHSNPDLVTDPVIYFGLDAIDDVVPSGYDWANVIQSCTDLDVLTYLTTMRDALDIPGDIVMDIEDEYDEDKLKILQPFKAEEEDYKNLFKKHLKKPDTIEFRE